MKLTLHELLFTMGALLSSPSLASTRKPLAEKCGPSTANIVCINGYSAVMPGKFERDRPPDSINPMDQHSYAQTNIPDDKSWGLVKDAHFIVYDRERGLEILGDKPTSELAFEIKPLFHDATVFDPLTNEVYFSELSGGEISQKVIDLKQKKLSVKRKEANPPLYSPTGGIYRNGLFYFCVGGSSEDVPGPDGTVARPGIYTLNATTGESNVLLNNYFGYYFSTCNDIAMDGEGNIWFTDDGRLRKLQSASHPGNLLTLLFFLLQITPSEMVSAPIILFWRPLCIDSTPRRALYASSSSVSSSRTESPFHQTSRPSMSPTQALRRFRTTNPLLEASSTTLTMSLTPMLSGPLTSFTTARLLVTPDPSISLTR